MCRKFHGAAFSTFAEIKLNNLIWIKGEGLLCSYTAENDTVRSFCRACGSSLLFESKYNRESSTIEIALASFDTSIELSPDAHIFIQNKVTWLTINDELEKFDTYRK